MTSHTQKEISKEHCQTKSQINPKGGKKKKLAILFGHRSENGLLEGRVATTWLHTSKNVFGGGVNLIWFCVRGLTKPHSEYKGNVLIEYSIQLFLAKERLKVENWEITCTRAKTQLFCGLKKSIYRISELSNAASKQKDLRGLLYAFKHTQYHEERTRLLFNVIGDCPSYFLCSSKWATKAEQPVISPITSFR